MHHIERVALLAFVAVLLAVSLAYYAPMLRHAVPPAAGPADAADQSQPAAQLMPPYRAPTEPNSPVSAFDALITVDVEQIPSGYTERGTSFPLGDGLWLTARHVVGNSCSQIILILGGKNHSASVKYLDPNADLAVLEVPGAPSHPGLPIEQSSPEAGQSAFAFGFPQGTLGGTQDALLGRTHLRLGGRLSGTAPVLAWSETQRFPDSLDSLAGISGGPMLDENGNVIGIIVAASVRRGRNYTVAPEILLDIQRQLGTKPGQQPARDAILQPVSLETSANALRQDSRIAQTYCIPPS